MVLNDLITSWISLPDLPYFNIFIAIIIPIAVYFYLKPINIVKDLSDVGYDHIFKREQIKCTRKTKINVTQESRKKRIIGNLPPVYPNGWFAILDSDDVAVGEVKHVEALGEHFAVFRGEDGQINVLNAMCPHLGANIAIGGVVKGNCIQCPFHGWIFSGLTGQCVEIPYSDNIPADGAIKRWHSCEVNTLIFVWYHAENQSPSWHLQPIPNIHEKKWWYRGRTEYYVNSHIQEIPENGADVTHLSVLHGPVVFAGSNLFNMSKWWANLARHNWQASWISKTAPEEQHIGSMELYTDTVFFDKFKAFRMNVKSDQIGPGYVVLNVETFIGPMIILQTVTPVEPLVQKVVHKMFYPFVTSLYGTLTFFTESILFERDVVIWNHKKYLDKPLLTKEENSIVKHRRWYNQFYSENSPRVDKNTLTW
ncbi:cholesterol 7-desaturase nvd [Planococcus citri]|uniref:cholesterol 7-desaturase nvd n=1 Tax=Planococcus citri TaxID=170843 RepID=UPI0031F8A2D5